MPASVSQNHSQRQRSTDRDWGSQDQDKHALEMPQAPPHSLQRASISASISSSVKGGPCCHTGVSKERMRWNQQKANYKLLTKMISGATSQKLLLSI